jgi:hypothetical protein
LPGVVGLSLSVAVLVLPGRDQGRMRRGLLDPAGRAETEKAWGLALGGLVLSVVGLLIHGVLVCGSWPTATCERAWQRKTPPPGVGES